MPPRRQAGGGGGRRRGKVAGTLVVVAVVFACLGAAGYRVYQSRDELKRFFSNPPPPDAAAIDRALEAAYSKIGPTKVTAGTEAGGLRRDRVEIAKTASITRANAEITGAVEKVGGRVAYGIESADEKGRKVAVTVGIAIGRKLVREIRLEKSTRK
ncbi:MAG: hypothetical protein WAW06_00370 [bacterium]